MVQKVVPVRFSSCLRGVSGKRQRDFPRGVAGMSSGLSTAGTDILGYILVQLGAASGLSGLVAVMEDLCTGKGEKHNQL